MRQAGLDGLCDNHLATREVGAVLPALLGVVRHGIPYHGPLLGLSSARRNAYAESVSHRSLGQAHASATSVSAALGNGTRRRSAERTTHHGLARPPRPKACPGHVEPRRGSQWSRAARLRPRPTALGWWLFNSAADPANRFPGAAHKLAPLACACPRLR